MRVALGCVLLVGCSAGATVSPTPSVVVPPAEPGCVAETSRLVERADALAAGGLLDAALWQLEHAPACAERGVADARARTARSLVAGPGGGNAVRAGWAAWLAGDRVAAHREFSRVVREQVDSGVAPRPFVARRGVVAVHLASMSFASDAIDLVGDVRGAVLYDVVRSAAGPTASAPIRFVPGTLAPGSEGLVLTGEASVHLPSPEGSAVRLPSADVGVVVDGRIAVLRVNGMLASFDLPGGTPRPTPALALPELAHGIPVTEGGEIVHCSSLDRPASPSAFAWSPATQRLVQAAEVSACAFDSRRGILATLHLHPHPRSPSPGLELELRSLAKPGVRRVSLGLLQGRDFAEVSFDGPSGLLEIVLEELPRRVVRWIDPSTGRPASPRAVRPRGAPSTASLPVGEALDQADLRALEPLVRPGRTLLSPIPPGENMGAGWAENGVRTADGATVAVIDIRKEPDPAEGVLGQDDHLLIARTNPLRLLADVPMRTTKWGPWHTLRILGERYAAARWGWTFTVVDLARGELRATLDAEASAGSLSLVSGDFLIAGGDVHDLSVRHAVDRGADARLDPGFLPAAIDAKTEGQGVSFAPRAERAVVAVTSQGYRLAPGAEPPPWMHCLVGEWIVPVEACAHRLKITAPGRTEPALHP